MSGPARVLDVEDVRLLLQHVSRHRYPLRNRAMVLLSFKSGLRACEIAGLDWDMVLRPDGRVSDQLSISRHIAKMGSARRIPIHRDLSSSLAFLNKHYDRPRSGPVVRSERGGRMTARGVVNWFRQTYAELGYAGCSSHSGRRTFITRSARLLSQTGGSLRDVQELAGHRSLTTTERYIQGDRDAQRKLVSLV
jgi:integrase